MKPWKFEINVEKEDDFRRVQPDAIALSAGDARVFKQRDLVT